MAAVFAQRATGIGQHVDVSIQECIIDLLCEPPVVAAFGDERYPRAGSRHRLTHPMTILPCKDGYVAATATGSGPAWEFLALGMEEPRLLDARFATGSSRRPHADEVDALMMPWLAGRSRQDVMETLQELRVPFGKVMDAGDIAADKQFRHREFFREVDHPVLGTVAIPGSPVRMSATPPSLGRAPLLGEHTAEILGAAGYSDADRASLRAARVIA
jgi:crotonobetainyl-CoA:carnitine CoA-transferase CaiB-like acyl-CoA transferase